MQCSEAFYTQAERTILTEGLEFAEGRILDAETLYIFNFEFTVDNFYSRK